MADQSFKICGFSSSILAALAGNRPSCGSHLLGLCEVLAALLAMSMTHLGRLGLIEIKAGRHRPDLAARRAAGRPAPNPDALPLGWR
jgi:hypothetical protein